MVGHGRPKSLGNCTTRRTTRTRHWLVAVALAVAVLCLNSVASAADATMQLRLAWGGGTERVWNGNIRLSRGTLSDPKPLGIEADEPGSMWIEGGKLQVQPRSGRAYDGVDLRVSAPLDAKLIVELTPADAQTKTSPCEFTLSELLVEARNVSLDDQANRLLARRAPGDSLRLRYDREHLVFAPGEAWHLELEPNLLNAAAGAKLRVKAQLLAARTAKFISAKEYDLKLAAADAPALPLGIDLDIPNEEGAYDLVLTVVEDGLRQKLGWNRPLAERRAQLIVIANKSAPSSPTPGWTTLLEIDPSNPSWTEWLKQYHVPTIPGLRQGSFGNGTAKPVQHPLGPMVQLAGLPAAGNSDLPWEAYQLPIAKPGTPHILEVEYPGEVPQSLGISVLEPNAAGAISPIQLDSGFFTTDDAPLGPAKMARHRLIFWPRTKAPIILFTNRRDGSKAIYGKIRVLSGPAHLTRAFTFSEPVESQRMLAAYMARPLFNKNFSASEQLDPWSGRSLEDWQTFYEGGSRLAEYLNGAGYNAVVLSVYADGSTIYPSRILQPTPRYDTGPFFDQAQDPVRKDALEMLLRLFDREQLKLVPSLQFSTPLPQLEQRIRRGGNQAVGLQWVGGDGLSWIEHNEPKRGLAPYYNILDPRVQQAVLDVVREVTERYAQHRSFGGISIELSADGFLLLPGDEWGLDDVTFARFERERQVHVPGDGPERFAARAQFVASQPNLWRGWRSEVIADFQQRLRQLVEQTARGTPLYWNSDNPFESPQSQRLLRPTLAGRAHVEEMLFSLGMPHADSARGNRPRAAEAVLLRPERLIPTTAGLDVETGRSPELDLWCGNGPNVGSSFFHEPQRVRIESFEAKSPLGKAKTYAWLMAQMSPSGATNRQRFIHALATQDSGALIDGGWMLPLGQEEALRPLAAAYRQLPRTAFTTLPGDGQPVTVRTAHLAGQTWLYAVNDSPWNVMLRLQADVPAAAKMEEVSGMRRIAPPANGSWAVELEAYELLVVRVSVADAEFSQPQATVPDAVNDVLEQRVRNLRERTAVLINPPPLAVLSNPGFETSSRVAEVPGWSVAGTDLTATLIRGLPHAGNQSVSVVSSGGSGALVSEAFPAPSSGRLSYSVWLRVPDANQQPTMRLAIEGDSPSGRAFYRFAPLGQGSDVVKLRAQWSQYIFKVDDLPPDVTTLRVRFDLRAAGEVCIDDLLVFDLAFSDGERVELSKLVAAAQVSLKIRRPAECAKLLDGYWPRFLAANVLLPSETPDKLERMAVANDDPGRKSNVLLAPYKPSRFKMPWRFSQRSE